MCVHVCACVCYQTFHCGNKIPEWEGVCLASQFQFLIAHYSCLEPKVMYDITVETHGRGNSIHLMMAYA